MIPPKTADNKTLPVSSFIYSPIFAVIFTKIGNKIDPTIDAFVSFFPKTRKLTTNKSKEAIMIKVDASIVINLDTIIDKPLTPPNTNSFGNRNRLKAIAINKIPITNSKYLFNLSFASTFSKI